MSRTNSSVALRTITRHDAPQILTIENDSELWQYSSPCFAPYTFEQIEQFCVAAEASAGQIDSDGQLRLLVTLNDSIIGIADIYQADLATLSGGVALLIYPASNRAQGYGRQALLQLIHYARQVLNLRELWGEISENNEKSRRVFLSCGFTPINDAATGLVLKLDQKRSLSPTEH